MKDVLLLKRARYEQTFVSDRINRNLVPKMTSKINVSVLGKREPPLLRSDLREQRCDDGTGDFLFSLKLHLDQDRTATAHKHSP